MFSKKGIFIIKIFTVLLIALSVRLVYICAVRGSQYKTAAISGQTRTVNVKTTRGAIADRRGIILTDRTDREFEVSPRGETGINQENSVYSVAVTKRQPPLASHIIGYTSGNGSGLSGIEKKFDHILKNKGEITLKYMADAANSPIGAFDVSDTPADDKTQVRLTVDYHIQKIAEEVMSKHIEKGAAVILDTQSFDILAMVSRPDYDTDAMADYASSSDGELLNRALMNYNAGSIFKIITAAAAMEKNPYITQRSFDCKGSFELKNIQPFHCHKKDGHGPLTFDKAFAFSCNCCFYLTGLETDASNIISTAARFGMGSPVLKDFPQEAPGNLPLRDTYSPGETLNLAIGQGELLVTPLQCSVMAAIIANDGIKREVNAVCGIFDKKGIFTETYVTSSETIISKSTASVIGRMMRECVLYGTGSAAADSSAQIAGKTGSAETGWVQNGTPLVHGWFCGFFPYDNPQYAMAIISEGGRSGADSCVTPFREIAEKINEIYPFKQ